MHLLLLSLLFLTACTTPLVITPAPTPATPRPDLQPTIDSGLHFLAGQYNEEYGLLQESPTIGQHRYYLTNDNALAAYVFELYGATELADALRASLTRYGYADNGFVELAWGEAIAWPPLHHKDMVVEQFGEGECDFLDAEETGPLADCVMQETHTPDLGFFYDWSSFSNLYCMGAVNEVNKGIEPLLNGSIRRSFPPLTVMAGRTKRGSGVMAYMKRWAWLGVFMPARC